MLLVSTISSHCTHRRRKFNQHGHNMAQSSNPRLLFTCNSCRPVAHPSSRTHCISNVKGPLRNMWNQEDFDESGGGKSDTANYCWRLHLLSLLYLTLRKRFWIYCFTRETAQKPLQIKQHFLTDPNRTSSHITTPWLHGSFAVRVALSKLSCA